MFDMLCLDLDGTLLNSKKEIDPQTQGILNDLAAEGKEIVIATGRHYDFAKHLTRTISQSKTIISSNGAAAFNPWTNERIFANYIRADLVEEIASLANQNKMDLVIFVDPLHYGFDMIAMNDINIDDIEGSIVTSRKRVRRIEAAFKADAVLQMVVYGRSSDLEKLESLLVRKYMDQINFHIMGSSYDDSVILEIMDIRADKWQAVKRLANIFGVNQQRILAFGDEINDIEMIRHAGIGVAMKNSIEAVRPYADRISMYDNNNQGIYHEIKDILEEVD